MQFTQLCGETKPYDMGSYRFEWTSTAYDTQDRIGRGTGWDPSFEQLRLAFWWKWNAVNSALDGTIRLAKTGH